MFVIFFGCNFGCSYITCLLWSIASYLHKTWWGDSISVIEPYSLSVASEGTIFSEQPCDYSKLIPVLLVQFLSSFLGYIINIFFICFLLICVLILFPTNVFVHTAGSGPMYGVDDLFVAHPSVFSVPEIPECRHSQFILTYKFFQFFTVFPGQFRRQLCLLIL